MAAAHPLPPGERVFLDNDGTPLAGGTVTYYIPGTTTPKDTWQDPGATVLNTNPITLDSAGRAVIWGQGSYREVVKRTDATQVWDQQTETWNIASQSVDIAFEFLGGSPPITNEIMGQYTLVRAVLFPANWNGVLTGGVAAQGRCQTNPTGSFTITIYRNATSVGTIVISTAGVFTFTTTAGATVAAYPGDTLFFQAPSSTDATLANVSWTISGALN